MSNEQAYEITWLIRRVFRGMATAADRYLEESGLSAADRAVMEFLYPEQQLSVPDIARRYQVSRQHVQVTVNSLLQRGLLTSTTNPKHKRSRLIALSQLGRKSFAEIRRNETAEIDKLFAGISAEALDVTRETLTSLYDQLK
ncbi:MAG: MarR family transcriptional regulator [Woeseiaceae bacterium]|jgi:DNA-binding MarR family transcriptional regulator